MIIDSRVGGFGDVWMRLLALYTLGKLTTGKHTVLVQPELAPMARVLFGERIEIGTEGDADAIYTHRLSSEGSYAAEFEQLGLKVDKFGSPEEMLQTGLGARRILCTDSFPSHFWQVHMTNVLLLLSQQPGRIVVHPGFPVAQILESRAPCCPCLNRARGLGNNSRCDMGHAFCVTWHNPAYEAAFEKILAT